tara:strand:+ start:663 stop:1568 length:906 start_codon:yes stop_codon:yes gene_type:complete
MKSTCAYLMILIGLTGSLAYAAADYDRIRKDISVMSQIVRGAFDDDADCRRCKVSVDGSYLAEQGAVFTIVPSPIHLRITGSEVGEVSRFQDWDFSDLDDLAEIPAMVSEILAEVDIEIGNGRHYGTRREDGRIIDRESRGRMRAISRERRHLEEEVRDIEIDLIHSEEDERLEQEERLAELSKRLEGLNEKSEQLDELLAERRSAYEERRQKERDAVNVRIQERLMEYENLILATFCDYGANLKSVPNDERITVILENNVRTRSNTHSKIYVFKKKDLTACQGDDIGSDKLIERAIVYNF